MEGKKRVLILTADERQVSSVAQYLTGHGYQTEVVTTLQNCVLKCLRMNPHYVLVSYSHKSPKVTLLPGLIQQTTKAEVLVFAEVLNHRVETKLRGGDPKRVILPPLSGAGVIRKLEALSLQASRGKTNIKENDTVVLKSSSSSDPNESIAVSGSDASLAELIRVVSSEPEEEVSEETAVNENLNFSALVDASLLNVSDSVGESTKVIGVTQSVACLRLESDKFTGYVVVAAAESESFGELLPEIRERLVSQLHHEGIAAEVDDFNDVRIEDIEFLNWAGEEAEFLKVADHRGDQVAMAFFRDEGRMHPFVLSESKMAEVDIDELLEIGVLSCNMYIHMPVNGRYLLYAKEGQRFVDNQLPRLKNHGVAKLHIRQEDIEKFKNFRAQRFFSSKAAA